MQSASELLIEYLNTGELRPQPRNARIHSKKQIRQITDSIRTFGFTNPVLIDDGKTVLAGHGRIEAAKSLGMTRIPCVRLSNMTLRRSEPMSLPTTNWP
jgi:ParB-like chromosome segregation protein Spo0J